MKDRKTQQNASYDSFKPYSRRLEEILKPHKNGLESKLMRGFEDFYFLNLLKSILPFILIDSLPTERGR